MKKQQKQLQQNNNTYFSLELLTLHGWKALRNTHTHTHKELRKKLTSNNENKKSEINPSAKIIAIRYEIYEQ